MKRFILAFALLASAPACTRKAHTVTVGLFTYDCANFIHQVKDMEQIGALREEAINLRGAAVDEGDRAFVQSIHSALELHDALRIEQLVVERKCQQSK